jgi:hypothetical protein
VLEYPPVFDQAHSFVQTQGKTENLQFIYQALNDSKQKATAKIWLNENRNFYHNAAIEKIEKIIKN